MEQENLTVQQEILNEEGTLQHLISESQKAVDSLQTQYSTLVENLVEMQQLLSGRPSLQKKYQNQVEELARQVKEFEERGQTDSTSETTASASSISSAPAESVPEATPPYQAPEPPIAWDQTGTIVTPGASASTHPASDADLLIAAKEEEEIRKQQERDEFREKRKVEIRQKLDNLDSLHIEGFFASISSTDSSTPFSDIIRETAAELQEEFEKDIEMQLRLLDRITLNRVNTRAREYNSKYRNNKYDSDAARTLEDLMFIASEVDERRKKSYNYDGLVHFSTDQRVRDRAEELRQEFRKYVDKTKDPVSFYPLVDAVVFNSLADFQREISTTWGEGLFEQSGIENIPLTGSYNRGKERIATNFPETHSHKKDVEQVLTALRNETDREKKKDFARDFRERVCIVAYHATTFEAKVSKVLLDAAGKIDQDLRDRREDTLGLSEQNTLNMARKIRAGLTGLKEGDPVWFTITRRDNTTVYYAYGTLNDLRST